MVGFRAPSGVSWWKRRHSDYPLDMRGGSLRCFIIQRRQILLDNVHSAAALWGEIECSTVYNVLLCAMYVSDVSEDKCKPVTEICRTPPNVGMEMFKLVYNHPPTPPLKYHNILAIDESTCPTVEL